MTLLHFSIDQGNSELSAKYHNVYIWFFKKGVFVCVAMNRNQYKNQTSISYTYIVVFYQENSVYQLIIAKKISHEKNSQSFKYNFIHNQTNIINMITTSRENVSVTSLKII